MVVTGIIGRKSSSGKGGSNASSSVSESPNTLQSQSTARLIEIISHGECVGLANKTNPLQSIYFDGVPAQNADGTSNYTGLTIEERLGLPNQDPFTGFSDVESEASFSNRIIRHAQPEVYVVANNNVDAVRVTIQFDALSAQDSSTNAIGGSSVSFTIESGLVGGAYTVVINETITDKCTSPQQIDYNIPRPTAASPTADWQVRVTRTIPDSTTILTQNTIELAAVTEITNSNLQYADLAGVAEQVDSKQFGSSIPGRSFDWVGMVLDVPSNYTPPVYTNPNDQTKRKYTGLWNGTFKRAWSDNPAWILYAMLTDKEWGLGRNIDASQVDKWALYQIAQYCDEFIDDGYGGKEPRYTINTQITSAEEAYAMLQSIASAFRGMLYWGPGTVTFISDQPVDPVKIVTQANVIGGEFNYVGSSLKSRHSVVRVTWNDPTDQFKAAVEVVEDPDLLDRFGWRPVDLIAYGCVSRGQAHRMGRWVLNTEKYESETVTYKASFDHADLRPGQLISLFDPSYAGARYGGRLVSAANQSAVLDAPVNILSGQSYKIFIVRPDGGVFTRTITNGVRTTNTITWGEGFLEAPNVGSTVTLLATTLPIQRSTISSVSSLSVTFTEAVYASPGIAYDLYLTMADGSLTVVNLDGAAYSPASPGAGDNEVKSIGGWTTPLTTLPVVGSVAFLAARGDGAASSTVSSVSTDQLSVTLSSSVVLRGGYDYKLELTLPDGETVTRQVTNAPGTYTTLALDAAITSLPLPGAMWGLSSTNINPRTFRVIGVNESAHNTWDVTALLHDPNKYALIEQNIVLPPIKTSLYQSQIVPDPPTNLVAFRRPVMKNDGTYSEKIELNWTPSDSGLVNRYKVRYQVNNLPWITLPDAFSPSAEFDSAGPGTYTFSVIALNFLDKSSTPLIVSLDLEDVRPFEGASISNLRIEGQADTTQPTSVAFTGADLKVQWTVKPPADWINPSLDHWEDPYLRAYRVRLLTTSGVQKGLFYTQDRRFVLTREQNAEANLGQPLRDFALAVTMEDTYGNAYTEDVQEFYNPPPALPTISVTGSTTGINIAVSLPSELDYTGTFLWVSTIHGFNPLTTTPTYNAPQTQFSYSAVPGTYYVRAAHYDDYSSQPSQLNISNEYTVTVSAPATANAQFGVNVFQEDGTSIVYNHDAITALGVAAGIYGQGVLATSLLTEAQVSNDNVPLGVNVIVNSDFFRSSTYWVGDVGNTGLAVTQGTNLPGYFKPALNELYITISGTPAAGTYFGVAPDGAISEIGCRAGDRICAAALVAYHRCQAYVEIAWYDVDNNLLGTAPLTYSGAYNAGGPGALGGQNADSLADLSVIADVPPNSGTGSLSAPVRRAKLYIGGLCPGGQGGPYLFIREPLICKVRPGQTARALYSPGPNDPLADQTSSNQAATIASQGDLATLSTIAYGQTGTAGQLILTGLAYLATQATADWATLVTGTTKPENNATKSFVYKATTAPTGAGLNDVWIKVDGSGNALAVYAWNGSAWILGADPTGINQAATISNQGTGATSSTLYGLNARDFTSIFTPKSANLVTDSTGQFGGRGWTFSGGAGSFVLNGSDWTSAYVVGASPSGAVSGLFGASPGLGYTVQAELNVGSATGGSFDMACDVEFLKSDGSVAGYSPRLQLGWNGSAFVIQSGNDVGNPTGVSPWPGGGNWANLWANATAPAGTVSGRVRCFSENMTSGTVYFRKLQFRGSTNGPFQWSEDNTPYARAGGLTGAALDKNMDATARIISANGVPLQASANYGIAFDTNPPVTSTNSSSLTFPANVIRLMGGVSYSTAGLTITGLSAGTNYLCSYNVIDLTQGCNPAADPTFLNNPSQFIVEGTQYTQASGGTYPTPPSNPGGGGKNACPAPEMPILLANEEGDGPGVTILVRDLKIGDRVWTAHELTLEWGSFEVVAINEFDSVPRSTLLFADGRAWVGSREHRWFTRSGSFTPMSALEAGTELLGGEVANVSDTEDGPVVQITVRDGATYVSMALCHNIKAFIQ